jgi:hypothetical protein
MAGRAIGPAPGAPAQIVVSLKDGYSQAAIAQR